MRLPAVIFTYAGDAELVPWCALGAMAAGLPPVICEDAAAPLPPITRGWLERRGIPLWVTHFPRRGNLNGADCAAGICRTLAAAAAIHDGHALKLDTDTVVIRPEMFLGMPAAAMVALVNPADRPGAYGMAYRLSGSTALAIAAALESGPFDPAAPEDITIATQAGNLGKVRQLHFSPDIGPFSAMPMDADPVDFRTRFDVLSVGNPPPTGWASRSHQAAAALHRIIAAGSKVGDPLRF